MMGCSGSARRVQVGTCERARLCSGHLARTKLFLASCGFAPARIAMCGAAEASKRGEEKKREKAYDFRRHAVRGIQRFVELVGAALCVCLLNTASAQRWKMVKNRRLTLVCPKVPAGQEQTHRHALPISHAST